MTLTELNRSSDHAGNYTAGWVISMLLHGGLVVASVSFVHQVRLAPQLDLFKWDVTLVSPDSPPAQSAATSALADNPPPAQSAPPAAISKTQPQPPVTEVKKSEPLETLPPVMPHKVPATSPLQTESKPVQPAPQTIPTVQQIQPQPPVTEEYNSEPLHREPSLMAAMAPSTPPQQAEPQSVPRAIVSRPQEIVKPVEPSLESSAPAAPVLPVEPVAHTSTTVGSVNPSPHSVYSELSPVPPPRESDNKVAVTPATSELSSHTSPVITASPEPASAPSITPDKTAQRESSVPATSSSPQFAALGPAGTNRPARPDYGWLSEVVLRRVEELKRYPADARVDRAEGKVVVKAVINEDGSVDDVEVFQSSGSITLDTAAVDLMRRAAPFTLPRSLGRPRVTIKIPMNYRLDR